jgi:hypothetical protein
MMNIRGPVLEESATNTDGGNPDHGGDELLHG